MVLIAAQLKFFSMVLGWICPKYANSYVNVVTLRCTLLKALLSAADLAHRDLWNILHFGRISSEVIVVGLADTKFSP